MLAELGITPEDARLIEVFSKIDLLPEDERALLHGRTLAGAAPIAVSSVSGEGLDELLAALDQRLGTERLRVEVRVAPGEGAAQAWLHANGEIVSSATGDDGALCFEVLLDPEDLGRFEKRFGDVAAIRREAAVLRAAE